MFDIEQIFRCQRLTLEPYPQSLIDTDQYSHQSEGIKTDLFKWRSHGEGFIQLFLFLDDPEHLFLNFIQRPLLLFTHHRNISYH